MGQTIGRAPLLTPPRHFVNLPKTSVYELWEAFNDIAEGFGLTSEEMCEILRVVLKDVLGYSEKKLDGISRALFVTLDDDSNELVDALEFLSALALISGMSHEEKVRFIFGIYDFDESGLLSVDEMILALRSSIAGLCKLSGIDAPLEAQIEHIAIGAFDNIKSIDGSMITRDKFVHHCITTPEVVSWIEYYADLDDGADEPSRPGLDKPADKIIASLARAPGRTVRHKAAMDVDGGFAEWAATEKKGLAIDILPQPPWRSTVAFTEPEKAPRTVPTAAPEASLELEWVYGLNAQRRQNVWYSSDGAIVYSAGALGVCLDPETMTQKFNITHTDLIECCKVWSGDGRTVVATGQCGVNPKINVWAAATGEVRERAGGGEGGWRAFSRYSPLPVSLFLSKLSDSEIPRRVCAYAALPPSRAPSPLSLRCSRRCAASTATASATSTSRRAASCS